MPNTRAADWFKQAENDLQWGYDSAERGHYSQSCFIARQVAEKSLKAIAFYRGIDMVESHSLKEIAEALKINSEIDTKARRLDQYYISTCYPDAFSSGAPFEYFTSEQAEEALAFARDFLKAAGHELAQ